MPDRIADWPGQTWPVHDVEGARSSKADEDLTTAAAHLDLSAFAEIQADPCVSSSFVRLTLQTLVSAHGAGGDSRARARSGRNDDA